MSDVTTNPNYEQFGGRTVPFAGDYLWIDSKGGVTYGVWTDWRDTVGGVDQRETTQDELGADACQCRTPLPDGSFTGDTCPRAGGLDQNIYGDFAPWTARRRCVTHAPRTARRSLRIGPSDTRSGWRAPSDPQQGFARMRGRRTHDRRRPRVRAEPTTRPL
jgi:hypothetical protein